MSNSSDPTRHERRKDRLKFINDYKSECGCKNCGEKRHYCLDLHHINPNTKHDDVPRMIRDDYGIKKIKLELQKCEVLCANCHREYHYLEKYPLDNSTPSGTIN